MAADARKDPPAHLNVSNRAYISVSMYRGSEFN